MPAIQIFGKMGTNKTHFATFYALLLANKYKKRIVANYLFHPDNLMEYCRNMGYSWLVEKLSGDDPIIYYCDIENNGMDYILSLENSIVLFDEIALYCPARGSAGATTKSSKFHKDLTQIRHRFIYLIAIAQNHQQIDSAIKNLAEETFHCDGITFHDEKLGTKKLYYKIVNRFIPDNYEIWISNPRLRRNPLKTKIMSTKSFGGLLSTADTQLFDVYPSFGLIHQTNIADSFPDSFATYYKEPLKSPNPFSWAYILPMPQATIKPKWFTWCFKNLPNQYFTLGKGFSLHLIKYLGHKEFILYSSSGNKLYDGVVICLILVTLILVVLYVTKYALQLLLLSLFSPLIIRCLPLLKRLPLVRLLFPIVGRTTSHSI